MERELIVERTTARLDVTRRLGGQGGRKPKMTDSMLANSVHLKEAPKNLDVSVPKLHHWVTASAHTLSVLSFLFAETIHTCVKPHSSK